MHPDSLDAEIYALLDDLLCDSGIGEDKNPIRLLRDRLQIRVARIAFKARQPRIDRADGIARFFKFSVSKVAARLAFVRDADNGDLFLILEILHEVINLRHESSFLFIC